ncbi:hypothetical protein T01_9056 [Trichinella spiralis]|uniref:Uncharacterized protein n=1 Tax=Trichinella spiralis TaxID=6334 RepID=A0A0V0YW87_TRISP|nr:hypothetical protein T01_9056 [Trichinella spiralis]
MCAEKRRYKSGKLQSFTSIYWYYRHGGEAINTIPGGKA